MTENFPPNHTANGLVGYDVLDPNYCLGSVPYVDGLCIEHFGSFEQVTTAEGRSNRVMDGDYADDKSIFIKAWPGPVGSPIDWYGPTWPSAYEGYPRPRTYAELQVVSKELITFPLGYVAVLQLSLYIIMIVIYNFYLYNFNPSFRSFSFSLTFPIFSFRNF